MIERAALLPRHQRRAAPRALRKLDLHAPLPRRLPLLGTLTPLERTCAQITAGLPLGLAIAWAADHALQLLSAVLG